MQRKSFNQSWFLSVFARVAVVTLVAIVPLCLGCEAQTPSAGQTSPIAQAPPVAEVDPALEPAAPSTSGGFQIQETFGQGMDSAAAATQWASGRIGDAANSSTQAASDAMDWAGTTFHSLKEQGLTTATDTSQWLTRRLEEHGRVGIQSGRAGRGRRNGGKNE